MKKLIPILLAVFAFTACEKDPDTDKLENGVVVLTNYQSGTNFTSFSTFYVPDSILVIDGEKGDTTYSTTANAQSIINTVISNMTSKGYTEATDKSSADLGIQLSYIKDTYYLTTVGSPWRYSGYWWPGYWNGGWGNYGWYYPYAITYSYNVGSMIIDMVNLNGTVVSGNLPIIWNAYINGLIQSNSEVNLNKTISGINQAFTQSSYIKK